MARWLVGTAHGAIFEQGNQVTALLSMVIVFFVCLTMVVGLCAAHGNPQVLNRDSEPEVEHAVETSKGSQRFGPFEIKSKLGSFRKSSFRNPTSFRHSGSFRIDCKSQVTIKSTHLTHSSQAKLPKPPFRCTTMPFRAWPRRFLQKQSNSSHSAHVLHPVQLLSDQVEVVDAFQGGHTVEEDPNAEPAVWQRSILRGERCAPLAFSGLILYDDKGNPLNPDLVNNSRSIASR